MMKICYKSPAAALAGRLNYLVVIILLFGVGAVPFKTLAQTPFISYPASEAYQLNVPVANLTPASFGGKVGSPGYNATAVALGSGFNSPEGVAVDAAGNVYVADSRNNQVKKIPLGTGTPVVIGSGFNLPVALAVDAAGNIYVADESNNAVKEILSSNGSTVTLASGFNHPDGVTLDAAGNVYVSDFYNNAVTEIVKANGVKQVYANVSFPQGITIDATGNVYVASYGEEAVFEIPVNDVENLIELGGDEEVFDNPNGVAIDSFGDAFVTDFVRNQLLELQPGTFVAQFIAAPFKGGAQVTIDAYGNLYAASELNTTVSEFKPLGGYYISPALPAGLKFDPTSGTISGTPTAGSLATTYTVTAYNTFGAFSTTLSIAVNMPAPNVTYNSPEIFTLGVGAGTGFPVNSGGPVGNAGSYSTAIVNFGAGFNSPFGVAVDAAGITYVADAGNNAVKKITTVKGSQVTTVLGSGFNRPMGVAVDAAGNVYVADAGNNAVKEIFASNGAVVTLGSGFKDPLGVAVNSTGVYVADAGNNALKVILPNGTVGLLGSGFVGPTGVAVDPFGNVYIADSGNNVLKVIRPGTSTPVVVSLGPGSSPYGVAVDNMGNVFLTDRPNQVIKEIVGGDTRFMKIIATGFADPAGIATDGAGHLYVADNSLKALREITPIGGYFVQPVLPAGTSIDPFEGDEIQGTPTALSPATNYTITTYNLGGSNTTIINLTVVPNVNLFGLTPNKGTLSPQFEIATTAYTDMVTNGTISVTLTPYIEDATSTATINGATVASGAISGPIPLAVGSNPIPVTVTASDGVTTKIYTVNVIRPSTNTKLSALTISAGTLTPAFNTNTTSYTASVSNAASSITITPTVAVTGATVTVNGTSVTPGSPSGAVPLNVGVNTIAIVVTAQDGVTTGTYTISVTRLPSGNAALANLSLSQGTLSPAFTTATTSYTNTVTNGTTSVTIIPTVADAAATVAVNGTAAASGTASGAITLIVGNNNVLVTVTAQDGVTQQTYTVNVVRPSTNARLSALTVSAGTLTPAFNTNTTSYSESVNNATSSITLTPTVAIAGATVTVNGAPVTSGNPSGAVTLSVGVNTINTVVTAQDGVTTVTYTVTVTRIGSGNANLANLTLSKGTLSPAFATATTSYTDMVTNGTTSITITPTVADATATLTVNGTTIASGTASGPVALSVGSNNISVVVTAQDGVTKNTYVVNVIRPSTNVKLSALTISSGTLAPAFNANTITYTASVTNATASITVTPTVAVIGATVTVNGAPVTSGSPSGAIALSVGSNTIPVVITAQDGVTTGTYTLTVTRAAVGENIPDAAVSVGAQNFEPLLADDGINVHQGVSPNGDGINDYLQIDNITNYPDNNLKVMTGNGLLIYEAKGYDNATRVFDGHSNKTGQMQLPGTYFYELDYTVKGIIKHKTGYLVLKY